MDWIILDTKDGNIGMAQGSTQNNLHKSTSHWKQGQND